MHPLAQLTVRILGGVIHRRRIEPGSPLAGAAGPGLLETRKRRHGNHGAAQQRGHRQTSGWPQAGQYAAPYHQKRPATELQEMRWMSYAENLERKGV